MPRGRLVALSLLAGASLVLGARAGDACSCVEPRPRLLSPSPVVRAPLNAKVRVQVPSFAKGKLVLRKHRGAEVAVKTVESPLVNSRQLELTPDRPLDRETRYELALVDPSRHPGTLVFGTFQTGTDGDATVPGSAKLGKAVVNGKRWSTGTSCAVSTPWVQIPITEAKDPGRGSSRLLYAVWQANAQGKIDTSAPPTAWLEAEEGKLQLGRTSYCDPNDYPLPARGQVMLGLATVDEAGNRSAIQRVSIAITRAAGPK